jgi:hypothetical protein
VYLGAIVVLGAVLQQGPSPWRLTQLASHLRVDRRTLARWRRWWLERVRTRPVQLSLRAFVPPVDLGSVPRSLLERFAGGAAEALHSMLGWLHGSGFLTVRNAPAEVAR